DVVEDLVEDDNNVIVDIENIIEKRIEAKIKENIELKDAEATIREDILVPISACLYRA
ncbi:35587_t:CDS:1, partial [Racocetra persica]